MHNVDMNSVLKSKALYLLKNKRLFNKKFNFMSESIIDIINIYFSVYLHFGMLYSILYDSFKIYAIN